MKQLIFKCVLLIVIVGGVFFLGGEAYQKTNTYWNLERTEDIEKFHSMPKQIEIAVFGASHGRDAFKVPPEGKTMFNFSLSSQTPQYDAALLRQYQNHLQPGSLVVLTVSYLSPYWTDTKEIFQSKQGRYYRILSAQNIVDVDLVKYWTERLSLLLAIEPEKIVPAFFSSPPLNPTYDERSGHNCLSEESIPDAIEKFNSEKGHWSYIEPVYPEVNPVMWDAYHEILELCHKKEWEAILVTPPFPEEYNNCYPQGFYGEFLRRMGELSEEYGVPYLDYSHDLDYTAHHDFFRNFDHMNLAGAAVFNERFFADVKALGLLD